MLIVPGTPEYNWSLSSQQGVRPATTYGTSVPPGANNVKSSWVSVFTGTQVAYDVWRVSITLSGAAASAAARDILVDIGIDPSGGTSYSVLIPDLLGSSGGPYATFSGVSYRFPLHIPAGARIGARASVNNASSGSLRVLLVLEGRPSHPEMVWKGTVVEAIGATPASSSGVAVTSGSTSEGSWTSIGTVTRLARFWDVGFGISNSNMAAQGFHVDLSAGSSGGDKLILSDVLVCTTAAEQVFNFPAGTYKTIPAGSTIWGRMQASGTPSTGLSMIAYAVS